ncbi:hypothetical protein [Hyphomonas sp.]|uniref:hypothetical protein n=1 Tax=Hyphomonas sp. TaxID=87 RepID=UPI00391B911E
MPQTPPPPDTSDPHGALIDEGGHLVRWLMAELTLLLAGPSLTAAFLRSLLRHYLVPAEAVLRRAIHLIAATLPPLAPGSRPPSKPGASAQPGESRDPDLAPMPRAPAFRLTEPEPRPSTNFLPVNQRPRISVAGDAPPLPAPVPRKPDPAKLEARLRRRLAALHAAWDDPVAAAQRLQRLRARKPAARPKLSFLNVPGLKARPIAEIGQRILRDLNAAAFEASLNTS